MRCDAQCRGPTVRGSSASGTRPPRSPHAARDTRSRRGTSRWHAAERASGGARLAGHATTAFRTRSPEPARCPRALQSFRRVACSRAVRVALMHRVAAAAARPEPSGAEAHRRAPPLGGAVPRTPRGRSACARRWCRRALLRPRAPASSGGERGARARGAACEARSARCVRARTRPGPTWPPPRCGTPPPRLPRPSTPP